MPPMSRPWSEKVLATALRRAASDRRESRSPVPRRSSPSWSSARIPAKPPLITLFGLPDIAMRSSTLRWGEEVAAMHCPSRCSSVPTAASRLSENSNGPIAPRQARSVQQLPEAVPL